MSILESELRSPIRRVTTTVFGAAMSAYLKLSRKSSPYNEIPVVINNFNRLEWLRAQLAWLETAGMRNISIIDNGSTFPPLLAFYETTNYRIFRRQNMGPLALWGCEDLWRSVKDSYYIYTDPDVLPADYCPRDCAAFLKSQLEQRPSLEKIGLGLKIDDLPDSYAKKSDVIAWESQYWESRLGTSLFRAAVDTTFALYRPRAMGGWWLRGARTDEPFVARHMPWYQDSNAVSEEDVFYAKAVRKGISTWIETKGRF